MRARIRYRVSVLLPLVLVMAACARGSGGEEGADTRSAIGKSKEAVIQIDVTGTFADLEEGELTDQEGRGSGFLIGEDGVAVTNNHVVTGATKIKVRVPGREEPVAAKVLGASECADLAVIDLEGEGYTALEFAAAPADIGDEVSAVGYPLGGRELTLKPGVVEKVKGPKATDWAAVPGVMQHSAEIRPGNSGGPLVNKAGAVVGVNYAGSSSEFYAITAEAAQKVVAKLRQGESVESLGLNSQAVSVGDETGGVFVASLATGSPPDRIGVQPGDILLRLEQQPLANDGTMSDYCDVLRSRDTKKPLRVGLARLVGPEEVAFFTGTLNQPDGKLAQVDLESGGGGSGGSAPAPGVDIEAVIDALPPGKPFSGFTTVVDDTGSLLIRSPLEWKQLEKAPSNPLTGGGRPLPHVASSPDTAGFRAVKAPGTSFYAFPNSGGAISTRDLLEAFFGVEGCTYALIEPVPNELFELWTQWFVNCNGTPTLYVRSAATPVGRNEILVAETVVTTKADLVVLLESLFTFDFDPAAFEAWKAANPAPAG